jgi:hypothetical protein
MGGIVSHEEQSVYGQFRLPVVAGSNTSCSINTQRTSHSERSSKSISIDLGAPKKHILLEDCPVPTFEEARSELALCRSSWKRIESTGVMNGLTLRDSFEFFVANCLGAAESDTSERILALLRSSRAGLTTSALIAHIVRYVTRVRHYDDVVFNRKLMLLGREHARIGVTGDLMTVFCNILLKSVAACTRKFENADSILSAWTVNFKYVITHMTAVQFRFLRTVSGRTMCSTCEGRGGISTGLCAECGEVYEAINGNATVDIEVLSSEKLRRHRCYSIPEASECQDASLRTCRHNLNAKAITYGDQMTVLTVTDME